MKMRHLLTALLLLQTTFGFANDNWLDKYSDMDGVTSVYISKAMFKLIPNVMSDEINLKDIMGKIESLVILKIDDKNVIARIQKEMAQKVNRYELLMRIKQNKKDIVFYVDGSEESIKELIMCIDDGEEIFSVIRLLGNFLLEDVQTIVSGIE